MKGFAKFTLTATAAAAGGTVTARPSAVATVSYSLAMNSEPRTATRVSWLRPGERVAIECQVQGDWVDGRWGRTNLWDRIPGRGYVSDGWGDTGTNGPLKGVPTCTDAPSQPQQDYQYPFTSQFFLPFANGASYPIAQGSFSSDPSWSRNAANATFGPYNKHAIDFGTPAGTRLLATGPCVIRTARWDSYGYGYKVVIDHGNDRCIVMGHLSRVDVKAGDKVVAGGRGSLSGNTGNSTGHTSTGASCVVPTACRSRSPAPSRTACPTAWEPSRPRATPVADRPLSWGNRVGCVGTCPHRPRLDRVPRLPGRRRGRHADPGPGRLHADGHRRPRRRPYPQRPRRAPSGHQDPARAEER